MLKPVKELFRKATAPVTRWAVRSPTCQWVTRNSLTLSGVCGCVAGSFVIGSGASSFESTNYPLMAAGVLEWTSFGTTAICGKLDKDKEGDSIAKSVLTKTVQPWRYPFTSSMVQQGMCGVGYAAGGIWNAVSKGAGFSKWELAGLVSQGLFCIVAPFFENLLQERPGWRHPRTVAAGCLFASSAILCGTAAVTGNTPLFVASLWFMTSNGLQAIARRQELPAPKPN